MRAKDLKPGDKYRSLMGHEYVAIDTTVLPEAMRFTPGKVVGVCLDTGRFFGVDLDEYVEPITIIVTQDHDTRGEDQ